MTKDISTFARKYLELCKEFGLCIDREGIEIIDSHSDYDWLCVNTWLEVDSLIKKYPGQQVSCYALDEIAWAHKVNKEGL